MLKRRACMAKKMEKLAEEIHELSDIEKLRLVNVILKVLDKPDRRSTGFGQLRHASAGQRTGPDESQLYPTNPSWQSIAAREDGFAAQCHRSLNGGESTHAQAHAGRAGMA